MVSEIRGAPSVLLLGGGYTLERVGQIMSPEKFIITSRTPERRTNFASRGWNVLSVDASHTESLGAIFAKYPSISTVVDSIPPWREPGGKAPSRIVQAIGEAVMDSGVRRLVYLSTTGVYGTEDGSWVDENTECRALHAWGQERIECESKYRAHPIASTILRLPAIYGPGRGIGTALKSGRMRIVTDRDGWSNRVHVADLALIIRACVAQPPELQLPPILCVSDDRPALRNEVVEYYCKRFSLAPPQGITMEAAREAGLYTLLSNQRVSNKLLKTVLRYSFRYPSYQEGAVTEFERFDV